MKTMAVKRHSEWLMAQQLQKRLPSSLLLSHAANAAAARPAAHQKQLHAIWTTLRAPRFIFPPSICTHPCWEVYDMQLAGCPLCGAMHACREGLVDACPCEKNDEGHDICSITGCCIKMLNFSDREFIDTVSYPSLDHRKLLPDPDTSSSHHAHKRHKTMPSKEKDAAAAAATATDVLAPNPMDPAVKYITHLAGGSTCILDSPQRKQGLPLSSSSPRCSVNKKNRYRSWVHQRMQVGLVQSFFFVCSRSHCPSSSVTQCNRVRMQINNRRCNPSSSSSAPQQPALPPPPLPIHGSSSSSFNTEDQSENIRSLIEMYVWDVLCSKKWSESMLMEVSSPTPPSTWLRGRARGGQAFPWGRNLSHRAAEWRWPTLVFF